MLEVDAAVRPRREQHDAGVLLPKGGPLDQAVVKGVEERRQTADLGLVVQFGEDPGNDDPVFQGIAQAGRVGAVVPKHPEASVRTPVEVGRVIAQKAVAGGLNAMAGPQEIGVGKDQRRGNPAAIEQVLGAVGVRQDLFQQTRPLNQAGL